MRRTSTHGLALAIAAGLASSTMAGCLTVWSTEPAPPPTAPPCGGRGCPEPEPPAPWPDVIEEDVPPPWPDVVDPDEPTEPTEPTEPEFPLPTPPGPLEACTEPFVDDPSHSSEEALLRRLAGRWQGVGVRPEGWSGPEVFSVEFVFDAYPETGLGGYGARCLSPDCVALYYGSDGYLGGRTYRPIVRRDGELRLGLRVRFDAGTVQEGEARRLQFSSDGNVMGFEFVPRWLGELGPLQYTLERQCLAR